MNSELVKTAFELAKNDTKLLVSNGKNNSLRSTRFVEKVGDEIIKKYDKKRFRICCQHLDKGKKRKTSGEWLLDLVVCEFHTQKESGARKEHEFRVNIEWAVESEFDTSLKEFLEDFTKLLSICSKNKLYLNGYRSNNLDRFNEYKEKRLATAASLIMKYNKGGKFYFGFWPSSQEYKNESFWTKSKHPEEIIKVFKWNEGTTRFELI